MSPGADSSDSDIAQSQLFLTNLDAAIVTVHTKIRRLLYATSDLQTSLMWAVAR